MRTSSSEAKEVVHQWEVVRMAISVVFKLKYRRLFGITMRDHNLILWIMVTHSSQSAVLVVGLATAATVANINTATVTRLLTSSIRPRCKPRKRRLREKLLSLLSRTPTPRRRILRRSRKSRIKRLRRPGSRPTRRSTTIRKTAIARSRQLMLVARRNKTPFSRPWLMTWLVSKTLSRT